MEAKENESNVEGIKVHDACVVSIAQSGAGVFCLFSVIKVQLVPGRGISDVDFTLDHKAKPNYCLCTCF